MTSIPTGVAVLGLVVPAITGLAGYVLAGRNERTRDERAAERETLARRSSARERLEEQRHASQRETLLELQDVLQRQARAVGETIFHDRKTLLEHGTFTLVGDELNQRTYEVGVEIRRLRERVLDPTLRGAVESFRQHVTRVELAFAQLKGMEPDTAVAQLDALQMELIQDYEALSDQLGTVLRYELGWLPGEPGDAS